MLKQPCRLLKQPWQLFNDGSPDSVEAERLLKESGVRFLNVSVTSDYEKGPHLMTASGGYWVSLRDIKRVIQNV